MYVRQGFSFWNRCAVEQLRTVSSRFVSHFLAQNGEGTARSWKNPMHQTKTWYLWIKLHPWNFIVSSHWSSTRRSTGEIYRTGGLNGMLDVVELIQIANSSFQCHYESPELNRIQKNFEQIPPSSTMNWSINRGKNMKHTIQVCHQSDLRQCSDGLESALYFVAKLAV